MSHNKLYRNFIILQEDEKEHLKDIDKPLSGYAKIEAKSDKCKISFYTQNLKSDDEYFMVLICYKKDMKKIVDLGSLKVDQLGKGEACKDYYINDIAGLGFSYDKISGAGVYKHKEGKPSFLMYGFINGESDCSGWKNTKIIKCDDAYKMTSEKVEKKFLKEDKKADKADYDSCEKKEYKKKEEYKQDCEKCDYKEEKCHKQDEHKEEKCEKHDEDHYKENHEECERHKDEECKKHKEKEEKHDCHELKCDKCEPKEIKCEEHHYKEAEYDKCEKHDHKETECDKCEKQHHKEMKCDDCEMYNHKEMKHEKWDYDDKKKKEKDKDEYHYCDCNKKPYERKYNIDFQDPCLNRGEIPITFEEYERKIEERKTEEDMDIIDEENIICNEEEEQPEESIEYEMERNKRINIGCYRNSSENFELKGALGQFFNGVTNGFEEVVDEFNEIKYCKWYKVRINTLDDMCDISDYNKYNIIYYPMISYYPYIKNYGYFMVGYKCSKCGDVDYIVYGIPGSKSIDDQPYSGKTGFVTWIENHFDKEDGCWLMFYDYKKSTVVIPMK